MLCGPGPARPAALGAGRRCAASPPDPRALLAVYLLFFVSGALGLVYEVLWIRQLTSVFGGTALATIMGEQLVVGGDIILTVQGQPVGDVADHRRVRDLLDTVPPGGEFTMTVLRLGKIVELKGRHP